MQENNTQKEDEISAEKQQNFNEKEDPNNLINPGDQEEEPKSGYESQEENRKIFVKNIPFSTTDEQFAQFFSKFGQVVKTEIRKKENGISLGVGFVEFANMEDKKKAMEARGDDLTIDNRILEIREARPDTGLDSRTLYIGNLPYKITKEMLQKFFLDVCPNIKGKFKINLKSNDLTGESKGYAYVEFDNEEDMASALKANGEKLEDRELRVEMKRPPTQRRGFRGRPFPGGMRGRRGGYGNRYDNNRERYRERYGGNRDREQYYRDDRRRSRDIDREKDRERSWSRERSRERERRRERDERDRERRDRGRDRERYYRERSERDRDRGERERGERERGERDRGDRGDRDRGERERGDRGDRGDRDRGERERMERDRMNRDRRNMHV